MDSFFLSETLAFLWLTFGDSEALPIEQWVFDAGGHPVKVWDREVVEKFRNLASLPSLQRGGQS
jgi:mannosyl-oligosaccharide alpha-1,2-mannosidase